MFRAPMSSPSVPWESWPHLVEWTRQNTNRGWGKNGGKHEETRRWHAAGTSPCSIEDSNPDRFWKNLDYSSHQKLNKIYEEIIHWKPIFFKIFKNKTCELFVKSLETFQTLAENTKHHELSRKAAMVLPYLILAQTTDCRDGSVNKLLQKRLQLRINGDFDKPFEDSHALQKRSKTKRKLSSDETKEFNRQMISGKVANAIRTLQKEQNFGVLDLQEKINGETVLQTLKLKHPSSQLYDPALIMDSWSNTLSCHRSIFDRIDAHAMRRATLKTSGRSIWGRCLGMAPASNAFWKSLGNLLPNSSKNSRKTRDWWTRCKESATLERVPNVTSRQMSGCSSNRCWGITSADKWYHAYRQIWNNSGETSSFAWDNVVA